MKRLAFIWILILSTIPGFTQLDPIDLEIPMRDSLNLSGHLYLPDTTNSFPTILIMTPYGKFWYELNGLPLGIGNNIASSNYAIVVVDWRCRFGSISACAPGSSEAEDGYDVVEWIAQQSWSDGKVGTWGPSALGNIQYQIAAQQPPHLVCCVPEVSAPQFAYQKYYPGGSLTVERMETLDILFGFSAIVVANPHYNITWFLSELSTMYAADIDVPMFLVGGWFDLNTDQTLMMLDTMSAISDVSVKDKHKVLIGPWVHGGTGQADVGSANQGELNFPFAENWNDSLSLRFFDHYLRNQSNGWEDNEKYMYYQIGDDQWKTSAVWPPPAVQNDTFYLHDDGVLRHVKPTAAMATLNYLYDPADPSPTVGGKTLNLSMLQGPFDQAPDVESRNDALVFSTPVLTEDLTTAGKITVNLSVSSDRLDTDFVIRVTDVYPDGRSILLAEKIQRMRFRNGYTTADTSFLSPGTVYPISFSTDDLAITFKAGHQLRLIVSSSNYPRFNRNMNNGESMYPNQNYDTLINPLIATNSIHMNSNNSSHIEIPVDENTVSVLDPSHDPYQISIFPNPANAFMHLHNLKPGTKLSIWDLNGRVLYDELHRSGGNAKIDLENYVRGMYILGLKSHGAVQTTKIIIN